MIEPLNSKGDKSHLFTKYLMEYYGETVDGKPHGMGKLTCQKLKFQCVGSFENGVLHGPAMFNYDDSWLCLTMTNGRPNGFGKIYLEQTKRGKLHGS